MQTGQKTVLTKAKCLFSVNEQEFTHKLLEGEREWKNEKKKMCPTAI